MKLTFGKSSTIFSVFTYLDYFLLSTEHTFCSAFQTNDTSASELWYQIGDNILGVNTGDQYGSAIAFSSDGNIVAIGAQTGGEDDHGTVTILEFDGVDWNQLGDIINGEAAGDNLGFDVSLSDDGTIVAIGATYNDGGGASNAGHVQVYGYSTTDDVAEWVQLGSDVDGDGYYQLSGYTVALSGDGTILALGAPGADSFRGLARVFQYDGYYSDWVQMGGDLGGETSGDRAGVVSISNDGSTVAVGAGDYTEKYYYGGEGYVTVYEYEESISAWLPVGSTIVGDGINDSFGDVLSLSSDGTIIAIGAYTSSNELARIYGYDGTDWNQLGSDILGEAKGDNFGIVSLSGNGTRVAIGAKGNDFNGNNSGLVQVFDYEGDDWVQVGFDIEGPFELAGSGSSVSLSSLGDRLAIGSVGGTNYSGHVSIYEFGETPSPTSAPTPPPPTIFDYLWVTFLYVFAATFWVSFCFCIFV